MCPRYVVGGCWASAEEPTLTSLFFHVTLTIRELKLRNYTPEDEELKDRQVPKAKPASGENFWLHTVFGGCLGPFMYKP